MIPLGFYSIEFLLSRWFGGALGGLWRPRRRIRYVSASRASLHLMKIMQHRMATEDVWDQSAYNMELWQPSRDDHFTAGCSVRVMSPLCFVNSKVGAYVGPRLVAPCFASAPAAIFVRARPPFAL